MLLQTIYSFIATLSFAMIFNAPRRELLYCGITGAVGWLVYLTVHDITGGELIAAFFGSVVVTFAARYMAHLRKTPATIYSISGIIPFVPGAGMYNTMYGFITNDYERASQMGVETFKTAGTIALAMILVLSLPAFIFRIGFGKAGKA